MGIARLLHNPASLEDRAIRDPLWNLWGQGTDIAFGGVTDAGPRVTRENSLQLLTVFGCQSLISDFVSMMPRDIYRKRGKSQEEVDAPFWIAEQANIDATTEEHILQSIVSLLGDGNYFWAVFRNVRGEILEVWCLDPSRVDVRREKGQRAYYVDGVRYEGELKHGTWFLLPGAIRGINPIEVARQAIGLGKAAQTFGAKFFANGALPSVVISAPGDYTDDQLRQIRSNWVATHGNGSHLPAVVTQGATVTPMTIAPEHAQFLESRAYSAAEIAAQLYRVDPTWLGINQKGSSLTYANVEQRGIDLVRWTLMPWMKRIERGISSLLPRPQYMKFNADQFMRADLKGRYESYQIGINAGFLVPDEAREKENLPPLPDDAGAKPIVTAPTQPALPFGAAP